MDYLVLLKDIFIGGDRYMYILNGLAFSIGTTLLATMIGIILGILIALMELSQFYPLKHKKGWEKFNPISSLAFGYVDIIRGTPAVVQLMILANLIFVGVLRDTPILVIAGLSFGINSGAYVAEIIRAGIQGLDKGQMEAARALGMPYGVAMKLVIAGLSFGINSGAYVAEIIRAGIQGLDKGQMEAARALGMPYGVAMKEVIIPQAIKKILPALVSEFITLLKETSIVGFIGGVDLLRSANIITSQTYRGVEPLLAVGLIYLVLTALFTKVMRNVEKGLKVSD